MNSAKKILKNQGVGFEETKKTKEPVKVSNKNKILLSIGAALIVILIAGICFIQFRPRPILVVEYTDANGKAVTSTVNYTEALYDIYTAETQYNSYAQIYQQIYGTTFWDAEDVDGKGNDGQTVAKKEVMQAIKQREILCLEAAEKGIALTDEEKKTLSENARTAYDNLTDGQKGIRGLNEGTILTVLEKQALADKYKAQVIAGLGIDEEALKATVKKEDYRQYTLQYYSITKDEDMDDAAWKKAKSDMDALQKKATEAKDFTTGIITDSDEDGKDDTTGISYATRDLIETDTDFLDEKTRKKIKAMKNDEVSAVIEVEDAYYVIKMVNNNDSKAYENQCTQVVENEKETQFETKYTNEIKPRYTAKAQSYWTARVELGGITNVE